MTINFRALTQAVNKREIIDFRHSHKKLASGELFATILAIPFGLLGGYLIAAPVTFVLESADESFTGGETIRLIAAVIIAIAAFFGSKIYNNKMLEHHMRLFTFASDNGLSYIKQTKDPLQPGMIFGQGHSRSAYEQIISKKDGNKFELGNYTYTTGSGKSRQKHSWGYVCIRLERNVPNMVLDGKANNFGAFGFSMSNLPVSFNKNQTLSLEGDFNDYFTLYAPKEYERDALYIFTPNLMAQLIDETERFDVEVVDNRLYVYSSNTFRFLDQATLKRLFSIISTVGETTINQTDYYADERVGDRKADIVAQPGRRLKQSVSWTTIVVIVLIVFQLIWMFSR